MKISIITATYNSATTIRDTIESVLSQTYKNIEHIIIDGASKDDTLAIIKEYEPLYGGRLRYICEPDKGIYDAMNKGISMATGDIIGILNSDDFYIDNNVIADISESFSDKDDSICGNLYFVDYKDTNVIVRNWKGSNYKAFSTGWHPAHPTFYVRKKCYDNYGTFDIDLKVSADFELMLRFIERHKISIKYIDRYIIKMRLGGESTGSLKNIYLGNNNILKAFHKNGIPVSIFYPVKRLFPKVIDAIKSKFRAK